ncbi:esterase/lipase family protein [Corynebacterium heidelbergense]|uniref:Triacylglycerol lipase n=1 Tax=Corynebacterium heidelbergense TaxID=2055947 RepID=A0A364V9X7_9CORY|nr:alpha/beta fold hydrolase [Corynebacterium heidelbergense]RAV33473.1 triacylglycerol lipase [Corynebacterium heidelbergense]WCZ37468.1 Extracellular esterase EstB precursor [Corynebacterium heidelbergense]
MHRLTRATAGAAMTVALAATAAATAPEAAARRGPTNAPGTAQNDFATAYATSLLHPGAMPPDVNDWNCKPAPEHPNPVVLIHGTWDNAYATWSQLSPMLKAQGYCAYSFNYGDDESGLVGLPPGVYGTQTLRKSGDEVAGFIDEVLARTKAKKVDLVGHSQGGIHARLYVQDHGGADPQHPENNKVDKLIGLGANNHGTSFSGIAAIGQQIQDLGVPVMDIARFPLGDAGIDQAVGSPFFDHLNAEGDTRPGIAYTMIATRYDWNVSPFRTQFLASEPNSDVTNVTIQDYCGNDASEHLSMTFSPNVLDMVMKRLDGKPVDKNMQCKTVLPFTGEVGSLSS